MPRVLPLVALLLALFAPPAAAQTRPNIVFVLTDDLSWNLIPYMPQVQRLQREGMTFERYVVTDSLCCPSRASIFTGRYPHSTGVLKNMGADGGFGAFHPVEEKSTFATALQRSGYRTALFGKYLNGYFPFTRTDGARPYVPPGWSAWAVGGQAYREFDYTLAVKPYRGRPRIARYGTMPEDYLTDVISGFGQAFVARAVADGKPFLVELSTYAPHAPSTPAPRDGEAFPGLIAPRTALFDAPQLSPAPAWLSTTPLSPLEIAGIDSEFRLRAQSVQAVDRMIGELRAQLAALGVAQNTYFVFSSDNGYHMGERRLTPGKQTAWDHDVRVPLVVVGPGVPPNTSVRDLAANVDLRPTFQELAGAPIGSRVEGRSLVPFLRGTTPASWRTMTLVEHRGAYTEVADPDFQGPRQGKPPSYVALRFPDALYVQFDSPRFAPEYYDLTTDPDERVNVFGTLSPARQAQLAAQAEQLHACSGGGWCQTADRGP
ncbi:sulfatase family protein [Solirubrobacter soli]|uniref:sulfatase family protein n=1 Tax=Solirubrobacter soli TaxID=363832 RepID=UPI00055C6F65|nr:sulfatase [Solirubrobacter soli]